MHRCVYAYMSIHGIYERVHKHGHILTQHICNSYILVDILYVTLTLLLFFQDTHL